MDPRRKLWVSLAMWVVFWLVICASLYLTPDSWGNFPHWQIDTWIAWVAFWIATIKVKNAWDRL